MSIMTPMDCASIVTNENSTEIQAERMKTVNILLEVGKLLDKNADNYDSCLKLLQRSFYHWLPDYFFERPASSSGKYHPLFANGPHGLMLHSLAVARIAKTLYPITTKTFDIDGTENGDADTYNIVICSAWLHDMFKYGKPSDYKPGCYTVHEHPQLAAEFFRDKLVVEYCMSNLRLGAGEISLMSYLIASHMGPYTTSKYSDVVLEEPETSLQHLLFAADYLASRKENDVVKDVIA